MNVTLRDVTQLYRFFCEKNDGLNASNIKNAFVRLTEIVGEGDAEKRTALFKSAMGFIALSADALKRKYGDEQPTDLMRQMKALSKESFSAFMRGAVTVARIHFPRPEAVEPILSGKVFRGCSGLYGLVMKRPDLQNTHLFLNTLPHPLRLILQSFGKEVPRGAGLDALNKLCLRVSENQKRLVEVSNPDTKSFVETLAALKGKEAQEAFYDGLKECCMTESDGQDVLEMVESEAEKSIPKEEVDAHLAKEAQARAGAFAQQGNHGNGFLVSGRYGMGNTSGQFYGDGIQDSGLELGVNPFSGSSLDLVDDQVQKCLKDHAMSVVRGFYDQGKLCTHRVVASGKILREIGCSELEAALMTVGAVVNHKLSEYCQKNGRLLSLDLEETTALIPKFAKEAILHGIRNHTFSSLQLVLLLTKYKLIDDVNILTASVNNLRLEEKED